MQLLEESTINKSKWNEQSRSQTMCNIIACSAHWTYHRSSPTVSVCSLCNYSIRVHNFYFFSRRFRLFSFFFSMLLLCLWFLNKLCRCTDKQNHSLNVCLCNIKSRMRFRLIVFDVLWRSKSIVFMDHLILIRWHLLKPHFANWTICFNVTIV